MHQRKTEENEERSHDNDKFKLVVKSRKKPTALPEKKAKVSWKPFD